MISPTVARELLIELQRAPRGKDCHELIDQDFTKAYHEKFKQLYACMAWHHVDEVSFRARRTPAAVMLPSTMLVSYKPKHFRLVPLAPTTGNLQSRCTISMQSLGPSFLESWSDIDFHNRTQVLGKDMSNLVTYSFSTQDLLSTSQHLLDNAVGTSERMQSSYAADRAAFNKEFLYPPRNTNK